MSSIKKICLCAICTALCYVLPLAFHPLVMGTALSPMHIPVLLCGLLCGWPYGAFCGVVGPLLSSLLSGMPPAAMLLYMIPELCVYGLFSGLLLKWFRTGHAYADLYLALVPAMLLGRIAGGIARAIFYLPSGQLLSGRNPARNHSASGHFTASGAADDESPTDSTALCEYTLLMNFSNTLDSAARHDDAQRFSWDEAGAVRPYLI